MRVLFFFFNFYFYFTFAVPLFLVVYFFFLPDVFELFFFSRTTIDSLFPFQKKKYAAIRV